MKGPFRESSIEVLVVASSGGTFAVPVEAIERLVPAEMAGEASPLGELLGASPKGTQSTHGLKTKAGLAVLVEGSGDLVTLSLSRVRRLPSVLRRPGIVGAVVPEPGAPEGAPPLLLVDPDRIPFPKEPRC